MLTKKLNSISEPFVWLLLFGTTFSNAVVEICVTSIIAIFLIKLFLPAQEYPRDSFRKRLIALRTPIDVFIGLLFIVILISFLRSAYFRESLRGLLRIIKYPLLYFAFIDFFASDEKRIRRIFWVFMYIAGFTFLNGLFQDIFGFDILRHHTIDKLDFLHRINSSFVHANDFGAYIITLLPLTFVFLASIPQTSKRKRLILILACILGTYCLIRTSSRGAWLGFIAATFIYFLFYKKKIAFIVPLIIFLLIIINPNGGINRLTSLVSCDTNSVWERTKLWQGTWNMVKEHPLLGFGINTFSEYYVNYRPPDYPELRYAHNSYLQMWSEIGILGLFIFLGLVFTVLIISFRGLKSKIKEGVEGFMLLGLVAGYIGFLLQSAVDTNLYSLVLVTLFWIINAYIISINKFLKNK